MYIVSCIIYIFDMSVYFEYIKNQNDGQFQDSQKIDIHF